MDTDTILFRLLLSAALTIAGVAAWILYNRWLMAKAGKNSLQPAGVETAAQNAAATILYFTTPLCAPCKTYQRPALEQLKQQLGDRLNLVEVDASQQPEIASQWGVLSVPTTFILDEKGQARHVNHGPTSAARLLQQLGFSPNN